MVSVSELLHRKGIGEQIIRQRQQQQQNKILQNSQQNQQKAQEVIFQIQSGQITDPSQIPSNLRPYVNIPQGYFQQAQAQRPQNVELSNIQGRISGHLATYDQGEVLNPDMNFARSLSPDGRNIYLKTVGDINKQVAVTANLLERYKSQLSKFDIDIPDPQVRDQLGQGMSIDPSQVNLVTTAQGVQLESQVYPRFQQPSFNLPTQQKPSLLKSFISGLTQMGALSVGKSPQVSPTQAYKGIQWYNQASAEKKHIILDKYNSGQNLTLRERGIIYKELQDQQKQDRFKLDYEKNKIPVIDMKTGVYRYEKLSEYLQRVKPKWYAGGSATQRFFEKVGGAKFYAPGERTALIEESTRGIEQAQDYETQEKELEFFKRQGGNYTIEGDNILLDTSKIASSDNLANLGIQTTHSLLLFSTFAPYMTTGATAKGKTQKTVQKQVKKEDLQRYKRNFEDLIDKAEDSFKKQTLKIELSETNKKITTENAREGFSKYLEELQKRNLIKGYVYDTKTGQLTFLEQDIIKPEFDILGFKAPQIKNLETTGSGVSNLFRSETAKEKSIFGKQESFLDKSNLINVDKSKSNLINLPKSKLSQGSNFFSSSKTSLSSKSSQKELQALGLVSSQASKQQQRLRQSQLSKQSLKQQSKLDQALLSSLLQSQLTRQGTKQTTRQKFKDPFVFRQPGRLKTPRKVTGGWIINKPEDFGIKQIKPNLKPKKDLFFGEIRKKGKWIQLTKPTSLKNAFFLGKTTVEKTIAGSFRIKNVKTGKLLRLIPPGEKFRFSKNKRDPFSIIEKRKYRLDNPLEIKQIKQARNNNPFFR